MKNLLLACLLILGPQPLLAETYKWVNEEGVVTYSQTPPPSGEAERVKLRETTPSGSQSSQTKLNKLRQQMADSAEDRELEKQEQEKADKEKKVKQQNCQSARDNLRKLEGLGNRLYKMEGEYRRLSEEERQRLMQQEQEHIKANCGK
ncbi:MAG: DUF4124 domain-containing protein [Candidatus Thiodiazotropha sp.]